MSVGRRARYDLPAARGGEPAGLSRRRGDGIARRTLPGLPPRGAYFTAALRIRTPATAKTARCTSPHGAPAGQVRLAKALSPARSKGRPDGAPPASSISARPARQTNPCKPGGPGGPRGAARPGFPSATRLDFHRRSRNHILVEQNREPSFNPDHAEGRRRSGQLVPTQLRRSAITARFHHR